MNYVKENISDVDDMLTPKHKERSFRLCIFIFVRYFLTQLIPTAVQNFFDHASHRVEAKILFSY